MAKYKIKTEKQNPFPLGLTTSKFQLWANLNKGGGLESFTLLIEGKETKVKFKKGVLEELKKIVVKKCN